MTVGARASSRAVWTFGGTVPGPVIRVKVGDTIRVHLKNPATNKLPHSIDFHASQVAWNDEMTSINPGEEKLYEWTADYAGVWMYHCGTAPALHHIANGMYGMVIVEPKEGLPPGRQGVRPRPERVVPRPAGRDHRPRQGLGRRPRPRLRRLQRRRQPVQGRAARRSGPARRSGSSSSTPARTSTARSTSSARSSTRSSRKASTLAPGQPRVTGARRPSTCRRPRARSSSSRPPRTASTRS